MGSFPDLPPEVLFHILSFLDARGLVALSLCSRFMHRLCQDEHIWRPLASTIPHDLVAKKAFSEHFRDQSWKGYYIWKVKRGKRWQKGVCDGYHLLGHTGRIFGARIWGENRVISAGDDAVVKIWNTDTRECIHSFVPHPGAGEAAALFDIAVDSEHPDQMYACSFGGDVVAVRVNLERKTQLSTLRVSELKSMLKRKDVAFDNCMFKSDLVERVIEANVVPVVERVRFLRGHQGPVVTMKTHQHVGVSCSFDGSILLWDLKQIFGPNDVPDDTLCIGTIHGHMSAVNALSWDGSKVASAGNDTLVMIWDMENEGKHERTLTGHTGWVWGLEQPFPGSPLYFSSSVDETVKIWDIRAANPCVHTLSEFQGAVAGICLNWDQQRLISGGFDNLIRVFDVRNLSRQYKIDPSLERITRVTSDNNRIVCGGYCTKLAVMEFGYL